MIEATGANARAAWLAGIRTRAITAIAYVWSGCAAALAGVIAAANILGADANNAGLWLELDAILAVVIGGTSLLGGRFSLSLSVVGALIIQAMNTGILLSGIRPEFNLVMKAAIVLSVLFLQSRLFHRAVAHRSEEHTSELQSLMRISYAVFCLKQKKTNNTRRTLTINMNT